MAWPSLPGELLDQRASATEPLALCPDRPDRGRHRRHPERGKEPGNRCGRRGGVLTVERCGIAAVTALVAGGDAKFIILAPLIPRKTTRSRIDRCSTPRSFGTRSRRWTETIQICRGKHNGPMPRHFRSISRWGRNSPDPGWSNGVPTALLATEVGPGDSFGGMLQEPMGIDFDGHNLAVGAPGTSDDRGAV